MAKQEYETVRKRLQSFKRIAEYTTLKSEDSLELGKQAISCLKGARESYSEMKSILKEHGDLAYLWPAPEVDFTEFSKAHCDLCYKLASLKPWGEKQFQLVPPARLRPDRLLDAIQFDKR